MKDELFLDLIAKYLAQELSPQQEQELLDWAAASDENQARFEEMVQLWDITGDAAEPAFETDLANFSAVKAEAWKRIDQATTATDNEKTEAKVIQFSGLKIWMRVAAVIAFLGLGYWLFVQPEATPSSAFAKLYQTGEAEKREWTLPDGSTVWLNEKTRLRYVDSTAIGQRWVELSGEAFFDVERDENKPFVIHSGNAITSVLGTSFNVRAYPEEEQVEVTVETGLVRLAKADEKTEEVQLVAGNTGLYDDQKQKVIKRADKLENANAWRTGKLSFSDVRVSEIKQTLERQFDQKIKLVNPAIGDCQFKLEEQEANLELILKMMSFAMDLDIQTTDSLILIDGDTANCQQ
ncbi:MAG: FecR domain-containing protein [Saprospiraceae bacterium]|nr:FecR domain-containing protein [Saprospiraceae bacterium]